jgi:hypothetical protein
MEVMLTKALTNDFEIGIGHLDIRIRGNYAAVGFDPAVFCY